MFKSAGLNDFSVTLLLIFLTKEYVGPDRAREKPRLFSGEISSERYRYQWGVPKKRNIILLTIWCILRWYIVTFDKTKQLWAYPMSKTNLHHFLFMSVTLTFWVLRPFWALKSDLASVIALQLQHFVCQTFWYIKIRNPSTNKKVIPQNVKWYRFPKGLLC